MAKPEDLIPFYIDGREAKLVRIRKLCADPEELAEKIRKAGGGLRSTIGDAANKARGLLAGDPRYRKKWIADNSEAIGDGDPTDAFDAFLAGVADELAYVLEDEILPLLSDPDDDSDRSHGEDEDEDEDEEEED